MIMIDTEMPENCADCCLNYDFMQCIVTGTNFWHNEFTFDMDKDRLPDCPILAEITPQINNTGVLNMRFSHHEKLNDKINDYIKNRPHKL